MRISSEFLSTSNKAFLERRIWGSDIYTSDSDPVCILQHSGNFKIKELQPTNLEGVSVFFRVSKGRSTYNSALKHGIKSKKMNNYQGHSIRLENYTILNFLGTKVELLEMASKMPRLSEYERKKPIPKKLKEDLNFQDNNMVFNLSFEMWYSYSLPSICDKGREFKDFTSWKLKDKVLYIETDDKRFEISRNVLDHANDDYLFEEYETFKLSEIINPSEKDNDYMIENGTPLKNVEVVFPRLDWQSLEWGEDSLKVQDYEIRNLKAFNFYNING